MNSEMFDSSTSLARSKLYFTVLQLLRMSTQWIQESVRDLELLRGYFVDDLSKLASDKYYVNFMTGKQGPIRMAERERIEDKWAQVLLYSKSTSKRLVDRIERKAEEVKSLRDGVCTTSKRST